MPLPLVPPPISKPAIDRICLIIPPSGFLLDERVFMTLGILKIAAMLERAGIQVELLDLSGVENFEEVVQVHLRRSITNCFGLTATTPQMPAATKIQRIIRSHRPHSRIILGGPHVTLVHAASRQEQNRQIYGRGLTALHRLEEMFDVLVTGDGELAVFEALGSRPSKLIDGDNPASAFFLQSAQLSALPFPARHLLDVDSYHYAIDGVPALSMIAQLGCPFGCGFCGGRKSPAFRRTRMRSADSVVAEMVHLHQTYGVSGFMLYDDELNVNPNMIELMQLITLTQRRLGVTFRLRGFIKAELFTDEQAQAMFEAGFRWILVGFESGHERILENIHKQASLADNTRCMDIAKRCGLKVKALLSVGHPGESQDTIRATHNWLLSVAPHDFDATVITTYPGTPYFDDAVETLPGIWTYTCPKSADRLHSIEVDYSQVAEYYKGVPGRYRSYVYTDHLNGDELVQLRDWLEQDVRTQLQIPFNQCSIPIHFEHSMGQGPIPPSLLRSTDYLTMKQTRTG